MSDFANEKKSRKLNKRMLERLIMIHNLIKSEIYPNVNQIMKLYKEKTGYAKIGRATIYRDIEMLRVEFGAPLEFDRTKNGYYYLDDNWEFALNQITVRDIFYLSATKILLSSIKDSPIYEEISQVIDFITETQIQGKSSLLNRIAAAPKPKTTVDPDIWEKIMKALSENKIIEFDYKGRWNENVSHRKVHPYQILLDDGMHYIFGLDESVSKNGDERLFSFKRISNLQITEKTFTLPENIEFESRCSGGKFGTFIGGQTEEKFVIEFYNDARNYIKDYIWADDQKITDNEKTKTTTLTFTSAQYLKIFEWLLSFASNARPIAPKGFVEHWKSEIHEMEKMANQI